MFQAVIFDIDGTIVDSVDLHAKAWQLAFQHFGKDIDLQAVRSQIGKGADQLIPVFLSKNELDRYGDQLDRYRGELFKRQYLPRVKAFSHVRALFERIKSDGQRIALASSAKEDELRRYKEIADIEDLVDAETSSADADQSKPYPDIFRAALEDLGHLSARDAIVVGDTPYDAEAAAKAHMAMIGLLCGGWSADRLRQAGCIAIYRDPAELLACYEKSPIGPGDRR